MNYYQINEALRKVFNERVSDLCGQPERRIIEGVGVMIEIYRQSPYDSYGWHCVKYFPDHNVYIRLSGRTDTRLYDDKPLFERWDEAVRQTFPTTKTIYE